jgi:hypothetical protein
MVTFDWAAFYIARFSRGHATESHVSATPRRSRLLSFPLPLSSQPRKMLLCSLASFHLPQLRRVQVYMTSTPPLLVLALAPSIKRRLRAVTYTRHVDRVTCDAC